jgi:hypothetical protein
MGWPRLAQPAVRAERPRRGCTDLAQHGNGIALIFARTETDMFFKHVWQRAQAILFLRGRVTFRLPCGTDPRKNSGAPSVLIAYGSANAECLRTCNLRGSFVVPKARAA